MSEFDDAWECSVDAEIEEMGEVVKVEGVEVMGVISNFDDRWVQSTGGKREVHSFSVFVGSDDGMDVSQGAVVEYEGRKGRVLEKELLGGGGYELKCGPFSSWNGRVPGV